MEEDDQVTVRAERVLGAVLGAAIGDAMGYPVEFIKSIDEIKQRYGASGITGYVRYRDQDGRSFAPYSDDTQMAEVVLRTLIASRLEELDLDATMRRMAKGFVLWAYQPLGGHRAPGNACMAGCRALHAGDPWYEAGGQDAGGCGSVMRAYPFGLVFSGDPERAEAWAVAHSKLTHRAPLALAACAAMARGMIHALARDPVDETVASMIAAAERYHEDTARMIDDARRAALGGEPPQALLSRYLGWAAHDAIAAASYVFVRHADDPVAAILEAVNSPGDSDSLGTLVGALTGARSGAGALPPRWVADLERSEELAALARSVAD